MEMRMRMKTEMEMEIDRNLMFRRIRTGNTVFVRIALQMINNPQIIEYFEFAVQRRESPVVNALFENNDKEFETTLMFEMGGQKNV
jgi:hypothetical protein